MYFIWILLEVFFFAELVTLMPPITIKIFGRDVGIKLYGVMVIGY